MEADAGDMLCPRDQTPLIPNKREGIAAQSCVQCHGVWFSRAALESLAKKSPQPATAEPPVPSSVSGFVLRRLPCPVCAGSQLQTRTQGDVEVSRCRNCGGIWLAKSEVQKILTARVVKPKASPDSATPDGGDGVGFGLGDFLGSFLD